MRRERGTEGREKTWRGEEGGGGGGEKGRTLEERMREASKKKEKRGEGEGRLKGEEVERKGSRKAGKGWTRKEKLEASQKLKPSNILIGPCYMLFNVRSKTSKFWHLCTHDFPAFPSALDRTYHFRPISVRNTDRTCISSRSVRIEDRTWNSGQNVRIKQKSNRNAAKNATTRSE